MSFTHKIMGVVIILGWMYLNLHILFPFILRFSTKFNSFIHVVILLFAVGFLAKLNDRMGEEYRKTLAVDHEQSEVKSFAIFLMIPCILLVGYSIIGAWFSVFDLGWEGYKLGAFNKIFFTMFCLSILSIPSRII